MIMYEGLRKYELSERLGAKTGDAIVFRSRDAALVWLTRLHPRGTGFSLDVRRLVAGHAPTACSRLSDPEVLELAAAMLYAGRLVLTCEPEQVAQGSIRIVKSLDKPAAFPLSDRTPPKASSPARVVVADPPTFSSDLNFMAQSGALVAAAQRGVPFCPI